MSRVWLLDLTRLTSRLGRGPFTGIDRVEWAWLVHLLAGEGPLWGLVHSKAGFLLLDRAAMDRFRGLVQTGDLPKRADLIGRVMWRRDARRARAETAVRALASHRALSFGLRTMLRRVGPQFSYLNLGHSNLSDRSLRQIKAAGGRIAVLVHDTIPLDHPEWARPDTVEPFRRKIAATARCADLVIHSTQDARIKTEAEMAKMGRVPPGVVAPLGVVLSPPAPLPAGLHLVQPYVITVGTIEPRKNHALLLDVWDKARELGRSLPHLYVVGGRGWAGAALFDRLDRTPGVTNLSGLTDGELVTLMAGARAMVFPSRAEGYGFPPLEAAALGIPVIASDLSVIREVLKYKAVYLRPDDLYSWLDTIEALVHAPGPGQATTQPMKVADWDSHFKAVLTCF